MLYYMDTILYGNMQNLALKNHNYYYYKMAKTQLYEKTMDKKI